jgi:hypothetical protein
MSIDLRTRCVAQYKMNEGAGGTVFDSSGNGYDGFTNGSRVSGKISGGLYFDEAGQALTTNNKFWSVWKSDFTLAFWIKLPSGLFDSIIEQVFAVTDVSEDNTFYFEGSNGSININYVHDGSGAATKVLYLDNNLVSTFNSLTDGVEFWHFMVIVVNGQPDFGEPDTNLLFGSGIVAGSNNFNGSLDDVMLFSKVLSTDEIAFLWNGGAGTEALWDGITESSGVMSEFEEMWFF